MPVVSKLIRLLSPLRAFIHDHKPRNISRKVPKSLAPSVKEESQSSSEEDDTTINDQSSVGNAQELSSQASSGEPHTPSPQYSAARVHSVTFDSTIDSSTPDPAREAPGMEIANPHLANLLNGLQRSAIPQPFEDIRKPQPLTETIPTPSSTSLPDLSGRAPQKPAGSGNRLPQAKSPPALSPRSHEQAPVQHTPSIVSSVTSPSLKPATAGAGHGRRGSAATADISPYLAQTRSITKGLRYISILESVAQESDRATSRMGHRSPAVAPSQAAFAPLPSPLPSPSGSVPAPAFDQSVIYSSSPALLPVMPRPSGQFPLYHTQTPDAFLGRPRTSHTYHSTAYASSVPRQSMNEHQLRSILPLNGQWNGTAPPPPPFPAPIQAPVSPMRATPPQHTPTHIGELPSYLSSCSIDLALFSS